MTETCPFCGREFENSKALGSHIHYVHEAETWTRISQSRSEGEKERFQELLGSCLSEMDLRRPRAIETVEQAMAVIPEGVSPTLDKYRNAFRCAHGKERLLKEVEEMLQEEEGG